jgi:hypothetical protein
VIRWKIDLVVLPIFLITQALQFIDKSALNYANLLGYQTTLSLKGNQFNYLSASESEPLYLLSHPFLTNTSSGLRWLFLWPVPEWMVDRPIPSPARPRSELLPLGPDGYHSRSMPYILQCASSPFHYGTL